MQKITPNLDERLFRHGGTAEPELLDFSASINSLGPPDGIFRLLDLRAALAHYPDPECRRLTEVLANHHGMAADQVVVGNGSSELIQLIPAVLKSRRAAIVEPTYTEYLRACRLAGVETVHWLCEPPDFVPAPFDPEDADLVWLCNPNNPTGRLWPLDALADWIAGHPKTNFVVDEAFLPFVAEEARHTLVGRLDRLPNLIVLRSMTKFYALAGLRLGYAVASAALADRLRRHLVPWSVNGPAQVAGWAAVLAHGVYRQQTLGWLQRDREAFVAQLLDFGVPIAPAANFVLLRLKDPTAGRLASQLLARGILVRDASNFVGLDERYIRVAVRGAVENRRLIAELRVVFRET